MEKGHTTVSVQRYLDNLAGVRPDGSTEQIVKELLERAVNRLHLICRQLLRKSYPRLMQGPTNLRSEELLGAIVERMIKAMRKVRPPTVRHFFALANQHLRWELNDTARRLDGRARDIALPESLVGSEEPSEESRAGPTLCRLLQAVESLPDDEQEVFQLVKLQRMSKSEAAEVIGVSEKTVHRRLKRGLLLLTRQLRDLGDGRSAPSEISSKAD